MLLVAILVAAVVAAVTQVVPESHAAPVNGVEVTQQAAEASIKAGTTDTCVISNKATFKGDAKRVKEFIDSASKTARDKGMTVQAGAGDLTLSYEFKLSEWSIAPDNCATQTTIEKHRGRSALQLPDWARGMIAAAAAIAIYLAVVFAVTAVFAFLAPEFAIYGELIGGCIGGFASTFVNNLINRVKQTANLTNSAVQCVAGAILNVSLGTIKQQMVGAIQKYLRGDIGAAVETGISHSAGHAGEVTGPIQSASLELSQEIGQISTTP